jgi:parallel beta-helix repeat protein
MKSNNDYIEERALKVISYFLIIILLIGASASFNILPAKGEGNIYIRADGSIDPPTAPIQRDGDLYTLTGNVTSNANGIVIERDNIILDGADFTLYGPEGTGYIGETNGTYLIGRTNVTINGLRIRNFGKGLMLVGSSNCTLVGNAFTVNGHGIVLANSPNNSIVRNGFDANHCSAVECYPGYSGDIHFIENNITNHVHGIWTSSPDNHIINNTIVNCHYGVALIYSGENHISGNDFSNACLQVHSSYGNLVENNTVNEKPLVYLEKASDSTVNYAGQVILVNCTNIRVENLSPSNTSYPVQLWGTNNSRIANNNVAAYSPGNGIQLYYSSNNTLEGNTVADKHYHGIHFYCSPHNTLRGNNLTSDHYFNFFVDGTDLSHFTQDIDTSNTVNGKPTYYWINRIDTAVPTDAGYVALVNCTRMTIQNLTLVKNAQAVVLAFTTNSTVTQNNFTGNEYDVYLYSSHDNNITGNDMIDDWYGVYLCNSSNNAILENEIIRMNYYGVTAFYSSQNRVVGNVIWAWYGTFLVSSSNNFVYHNSFIGPTTHQFFVQDSVNVWDDGYPSGGNYWSDYNGTDFFKGPFQDEPGSDGIGDTPHIIDANNTDNYPFIEPWHKPDIEMANVTTSKTGCVPFPTVCQNCSLSVDLRVENQGSYSETFNVTVYANDTGIKVFENATLFLRSSMILSFVWDTTGFERGNFTISVAIDPVSGESDTADNEFRDCWVLITSPGDINADQVVDIFDCASVALAFGSRPGDPNWSPNADINNDGIVDIFDIVVVALHFGESG